MIFKRILELANSMNIPISRIERECGIGNGTIRGWETVSPSVSNLKKVADYLGVTVGYLIGEEPETSQ